MTRVIVATRNGRIYRIPDIWVAGICTANPGLTTAQAVAYWIDQTDLDDAERAR